MKPEHEFTLRMAKKYLSDKPDARFSIRSYNDEGKLILELVKVIEELRKNETEGN